MGFYVVEFFELERPVRVLIWSPVFSHQCQVKSPMFPFCPTPASLRYGSVSSLFHAGNSFGAFSTNLIRFTVCPFRKFCQQKKWGLVSATGCWVRECCVCVPALQYSNGIWHVVVFILCASGMVNCMPRFSWWSLSLQGTLFSFSDSDLRDFRLAWGVSWVLAQPGFTLCCLLKKKKKKLTAYLFACPYVLYTLV